MAPGWAAARARRAAQPVHAGAATEPERTRRICVHLATPVRARRRSLSDSFRGGGCAPGPASTISSCPSPCMHRAPALTAVSEFQHGELLRARRGAESHTGAPRAATEGARHVRSRRGCTAQGPRRPKGVAPAAGECPRHAVGRMKSVEDFFFREISGRQI